jgi:RNA binding exosome subunit
MIRKTYYTENNNKVNEIIQQIIDNYICFVDVETIEMNCYEIVIEMRTEDKKNIEKMLKDIILK